MLIDLMFALICAFILSLLLNPRPWRHHALEDSASIGAGALLSMLILLPFIWAGGIWITPLGHPLWGSYWLGFLAVAVFVGLLILAITPAAPAGRRVERQSANAEERSENALAAFGFFAWILLLASIVAIILRYLAPAKAVQGS